MKLLQTAIDGIRHTALAKHIQDSAIENLKIWFEDDRFGDYRSGIEGLIETRQFELLVDSFYRMIAFGTGGRRGWVGIGPNRINPYSVGTSVQGHCEFLKMRFPDGPWKVVLAWDVRKFEDQRKLYKPGTTPNLSGLTSIDLAKMAAEVYAANGVEAVMLDPNENSFVSTPELSFHIFRLKAQGGLNVSASHNPPDDNGAKFYNAAGGQEVPPFDEELVDIASAVREVRRVPFTEARTRRQIRYLTLSERRDYIDHVASLGFLTGTKTVKIAFSPLHGTGATNVVPVLEKAGFTLELTEQQVPFDGSFPTVPYQIPNPEVPSAMEAVIETARNSNCVAAMATDPDADRIGVAIPDGADKWHCLTGNQIGLLMAHHLLRTRKAAGRLNSRNYVVKTEVTTRLLEQLAKAYDVRVIGHLLVGFKYIGDVLDQTMTTGKWHDFEASGDDFVMGMEESHGVLASPEIRDKDASHGALAISELAQWCQENGTTVWNELLALYKEHGFYGTGLKSLVMEGAEGLENIRKIQDSLRADPPEEIAGRRVVRFADRQDEQGPFGPMKSETDRSSRDVLVFELEDGARLILRPSGTEPKNKTYLEFAREPMGTDASNEQLEDEMAVTQKEISNILSGWEQTVLDRLDIDYPAFATRFADSIPLKKKLEFARRLVTQLPSQLEQPTAEVVRWVSDTSADVAPLPLLMPGLIALENELPPTIVRSWTEVLEHLG